MYTVFGTPTYLWVFHGLHVENSTTDAHAEVFFDVKKQAAITNTTTIPTMARLTILLVALVAALANAFAPVPVVHTGKSNFP